MEKEKPSGTECTNNVNFGKGNTITFGKTAVAAGANYQGMTTAPA
ncbi:MAG: hypothetical protein AAB355_02650 [Patescibacteria group bacterium]